jgi:hypothetical protein
MLITQAPQGRSDIRLSYIRLKRKSRRYIYQQAYLIRHVDKTSLTLAAQQHKLMVAAMSRVTSLTVPVAIVRKQVPYDLV